MLDLKPKKYDNHYFYLFFSAVLGFHGMLNQTQFYASERDEKLEGGGFTGKNFIRICKPVYDWKHFIGCV